MELHTLGLMLILDLSPKNEDGWFPCDVTVEVPGFAGKYSCFVWCYDLEKFRSELTEMAKKVGEDCSANLISTDPGVELHFAMKRLGQIEGRYCLQNFDTTGQPKLSGKFQMDQTYLSGMLVEVNKLLHDETDK